MQSVITESAGQDTAHRAPKKYQIIYADPPWKYSFAPSKKMKIENHYKTLSVDEICTIVPPAEKNSVLFLWSTSPKLIEAIRVINAWGFSYTTHAIWDKGSRGMGYWFLGQHEMLIVAKRGQFSPPAPAMRCGSMLRYPNQNRLARINGKCNVHSLKPWEIRAMISRWYPECSKLEMFARQKTEGWDIWGNEISNDVEIEESPVLGEEVPAQNTVEICHTAPNSGRDAMPLDIFDGVQ